MADMSDVPDQAATQPKHKYVLRAVGYFLALTVVNTVAYSVIGRSLESVAPGWLTQLLENLAYLIGVVALTWAFCVYIDKRSLRDLGLQRQGWLGKLAAGWGLGIFLQLIILVALAVFLIFTIIIITI